MATTEGNRKIAKKLKRRYGVDANGKSRFHKRVGREGGLAGPESYFAMLKRTDPEKLKEIANRGARNSHAATTKPDQTEG